MPAALSQTRKRPPLRSAANSIATDSPGNYHLKWSGEGNLTSDDLIAKAGDWLKQYPIILWEDLLSEDDWDGFAKFNTSSGYQIEVVGDDIFVTNTK